MTEVNYVYDTGVLLDIYHGRTRVSPYFERLFDKSVPAYLSTVSEAELWRGLRPNEIEQHEALLSHFVLLPVISAVARQAGQWMQIFGSHGLGWMDAFIAATALTSGTVMLTRDRHLAALLGEQVAFEAY